MQRENKTITYAARYCVTLFRCDFRKVSSGPFVSFLIDELYAYTMYPNFPIKKIIPILELC